MSSTRVQPAPAHDDPPPKLQLSLTQVIASALAAITATVAASYFGVSGTVIGAALASVVTVIGNAVYSHSIRRTRERVLAVAPGRRIDAWHPAPPRPEPRQPAAAGRPTTRWIVPWRRLALGAVALFVLVVGVVTVVEVAAGKPLPDIVQNQSGSGTSFFGDAHGQPAPKPDHTPAVAPSSTAGITPSAPPASGSSSAAPPPSPTPTDSDPTSPSDSPSPSTSPSSTPTTGPPSPSPSPSTTPDVGTTPPAP